MNCRDGRVGIQAEVGTPSAGRGVLGRGVLLLGLLVGMRLSAAVVWQEGFEGGVGGWAIEGTADVWQVGAPTSGPGSAHGGQNVAGTRLAGNYPNNADTRLISPEFVVPAAGEQPRFRYYHWYDMAFDSHYGRVQVRVVGGAWQDVDERVRSRSGAGAWVQRIVDLRPFGGQTIQIAFRFVSTSSTTAAGWYIDDVGVDTGAMAMPGAEDFEGGFGDWSVENGVWQLGVPTAENGPSAAHSGSRCMGTVLSGNYPNGADARLVSPEFLVPPALENPRFRYFHWHATSFDSHYGQLQVRTSGGAWQDVDGERVFLAGGAWVQRIVDLRPLAGQRVQFGFRLVTTTSTTGAGWYVDSVALETGPLPPPDAPGFEDGFGGWSAEGGVWQVGKPTYVDGPAPHSGEQCAGTILAGRYPNGVDARLVSPEFVVPAATENPRFRYWHWHATAFVSHYGQVQIRTSGGAWQDLPGERVQLESLGWSQRILDLRPYSGQPVQVGFRFVSTTSTTDAGWYVDDAGVETGPMVLNNPDGFENGFGDWSSEGGVWQIGAPTAANGPAPHSGTAVAGTILAGNYFNNAEARLVTPEFVVPGLAANPQLSFWHWFRTPFPSHNARVQASADGRNWTDLSAVFSGNGTNWTRQLIDLKPYAGQRIRIGFQFLSTTSTTAPGWYLDDVEIVSDTLDPVADQVIPEAAELRLPLVARGDNLRFEFLGAGPAGATVGPTAPELVWTPGEAQGPGVFEGITVGVLQPGNALTPVDRQSFRIEVTEINVAPELAVPALQTVREQTPFEVRITATDTDLPVNPLTLALVSGPAGLTLDPGTGTVAWTPTEAQGPGNYTVVVRVTDVNRDAVNDLQLSTTREFDVVVQEVNLPPQIVAPADQVIDEGTAWTLAMSASDADVPANALAYSLGSAPAGMTIDAATGVIRWTPTEAQGPTVVPVTVMVTDLSPGAVNETQLTASTTFQITVREVNQAPELGALTDLTQHYGQPVSVQATATDADLPANVLTYGLDEAPAGMTVDAGTGRIAWQPSAGDVGTHRVTVRVNDGGTPALSATRTFVVTVTGEGSQVALTLLSGGLVQLAITGDLGRYELEVSTDLETWVTLDEIRVTASPRLYVDPTPATNPVRFYRLRFLDP